MKKSVKGWLIAAAALTVSGILLCVGAAAAVNFDIQKLSTVKYITNTHEISADFSSIDIDVLTADIELLPAEAKTCRVVCYEQEKVTHTVKVSENTLTIRYEDARHWYDYINLNFRTPKVTVYLPKETYDALSVDGKTGDVTISEAFTFADVSVNNVTGDVRCGAAVKNTLRISLSTGDIRLENLSAGAVALSSSTGDVLLNRVTAADSVSANTSTGNVVLSDVTCGSCHIDTSTGNITLRGTVASGDFRLSCSTGNVCFDRSDAAEIAVKTNTGDVTGTLRSEKIFFAKTDTGDVSVPQSTSGGKCEITTDTGNIRIDIEK